MISNQFRPGVLIALLISMALPTHSIAQTTATVDSATTAGKEWPDPKRFEAEIAKFESMPPVAPGGIVAYGSSSMRGWHKTIQDDLKPLPIIPRGFGGSNMNDALFFMDRVVVPVKPKAVLLYEGDNDVASGFFPRVIFGKYQEFVNTLHKALPATHVYIISIKPSPSRWKLWPVAVAVNDLLRKLADEDPLVTFIDVASPMLDSNGLPQNDLYLSDKLHMTRKGYEIWRDAVRPVLLKGAEKTGIHETQGETR